MFVRSYAFMFLAILFWSMNPVANKIALEEIPVPQLVSMRAVFSSIILLVFSFAIGYRYSPKKIGWRPFVLGFLDPGLTSLLFVYSLTVLSAANTILIIALLPFSQSILGRIVFKEKIQPKKSVKNTFFLMVYEMFSEKKHTQNYTAVQKCLIKHCFTISFPKKKTQNYISPRGGSNMFNQTLFQKMFYHKPI